MHYALTPNKPRPLASVCVGVTRAEDARWRGVPERTRVINTLARIALQQRARDRKRYRR